MNLFAEMGYEWIAWWCAMAVLIGLLIKEVLGFHK